MFQSLEVFQIASSMAKHAGQRQALISENIANVDTPDFQARDVPTFSDIMNSSSPSLLKATRTKHMHGIVENGGTVPTTRERREASVNGNTVSLESEMLKAVETKRQHDRALTIYKSALDVLRMNFSK